MFFKEVAGIGLAVVASSVLAGLLAIIVCEYCNWVTGEIVEFEFKSGRMTAMEFTSYIRRLLVMVEESRVRMRTQGEVYRPLISFLLQHQCYCKLADC